MRGRGRRRERLAPGALDGRAAEGPGYQFSGAGARSHPCLCSALLAALLGWVPSDRPQGLTVCTGVVVRGRGEPGTSRAGSGG